MFARKFGSAVWSVFLNMDTLSALLPARWLNRFSLAPTDLLRDATYRRLWTSILISSFGGQVTLLALPLTAAVLMHAAPTQMGLLTAMELVPFVLFSLPTGVWLDRVRKLPVYVVGELSIAFAVATVPVAWWFGWLSMRWLYLVGFLIGAVNTTAGSAAQIVLTQIVPRERLVEAHAKNALAIGRGGSDRARRGGRADQIDRSTARLAGRRLPVADLGVHSARRAGQGKTQHTAPGFLGGHARGPQFRARPPAAGDHGDLRRHMADVQPGGRWWCRFCLPSASSDCRSAAWD